MIQFDIESFCFKGFSLKGWKDNFKITYKKTPSDYAQKSKDFFKENGAKLITDSNSLRFSRGNIFWSIFNFGPEKRPKQTIDLKFQIEDEQLVLELEYLVCCYFVLRFPPFGLKTEVENLANRLLKQ